MAYSAFGWVLPGRFTNLVTLRRVLVGSLAALEPLGWVFGWRRSVLDALGRVAGWIPCRSPLRGVLTRSRSSLRGVVGKRQCATPLER